MARARALAWCFAALGSVLAAGCATIGDDEIERGRAVAGALPEVAAARSDAAWTGWRGARRDGVAPRSTPLPRWSADEPPPVLWRRRVGAGTAGPVVADGLVFCFARAGDDEVVYALDASTGAEVWAERRAIAPWEQAWETFGKIDSGPLATPVLDGETLYTVGVHGRVDAFDARSGETRFSIPAAEIADGDENHRYGHAASPLVHDGRLFVCVKGEVRGSVVAIDAQSGATLWRALPETVTYTSPVLARIAGGDQLVVRTWERVAGLDPSTGAILWEHEAEARSFGRDCATPVLAGDTVYLANYLHGTIAVRVTRAAGAWRAERVYRSGALGCETSTPVYHAGHLFGLHKRGKIVCMDARTGERAWIAREFGSHFSLLAFGDTALALDERGVLVRFPLDPTAFEPAARWEIGASTWAHPAVGEGGFYYRDGEDIVCLALAPEPEP